MKKLYPAIYAALWTKKATVDAFCRAILAGPENPDATKLGKAIIVKRSTCATLNNFSPEFHDWGCQFKRVAKVIQDATDPIIAMDNIIKTKKLPRASGYRQNLHPGVIKHLKSIWR
jgi:hypothetical protein